MLVAILRQMTSAHFQRHLASFETVLDLEDFLMELLLGVRNLVVSCAFPPDWCDMILLQNRCVRSLLVCPMQRSPVALACMLP